MNYNLNSGYGKHIAGAAHSGVAPTGNVFIVADSGTAKRDRLQEIFVPDAAGAVRFFATIDAAIGACTANAGDVILVAPGHTETVTAAAGIAADVAGISIIGLGKGSDVPTITFDTATTASFKISAANITVKNIKFVGGIDALVNPVHIDAAYATFLDIVTEDSTGQATDFIVTTANADELTIDGWKHNGAAAAGADTAISIVGGDNIRIDNFDIDGNFAVSAIENVTTAATKLLIGTRSVGYNTIRTRNAADVLVTLVATTTGFVDQILGRVQDNAANITEAIVGADANFGTHIFIANADGEKALEWNGTASTDA